MKQHLLVLAFASFCIVANAQKVLFNQLNDGLYNSRIKLVDEFFDRFNGKEGHPGIAKNDKNYRKKNLTFIFNGKIFKSKDGLNLNISPSAFVMTHLYISSFRCSTLR